MSTHHNYDDCDKGAYYTLQGDVDDHDDTWYPLHARSPRGRWGKTFQTKAFFPCSLSGWSAGLGGFLFIWFRARRKVMRVVSFAWFAVSGSEEVRQCLFACLCVLLKMTRMGGEGAKHSRLRIDGSWRMDGFSFWILHPCRFTLLRMVMVMMWRWEFWTD